MKTTIMKQIILSIVIVLNALIVTAQINAQRQGANYEAANWKIWMLDNPQQIRIVAPPTAVQSKAELQTIRQGMANLDEKNCRK